MHGRWSSRGAAAFSHAAGGTLGDTGRATGHERGIKASAPQLQRADCQLIALRDRSNGVPLTRQVKFVVGTIILTAQSLPLLSH